MEADIVGRSVEHLGHLSLGQPDRLSVEADIHAHGAVRGPVDNDLAAWRLLISSVAHGSGIVPSGWDRPTQPSPHPTTKGNGIDPCQRVAAPLFQHHPVAVVLLRFDAHIAAGTIPE